jgi:GxxExxY protein
MESEVRRLAQHIWDSLGPGYSESVYHCAFEVALRSEGVPYETERIIPVFYQGQNVGHVRADLILRNSVVLELKSVARLTDAYRIQTRNYLKLLGLETGCLINFPDRNSPMEFEVITLSSKTPTEVLDISSPKSDPECTVSPST